MYCNIRVGATTDHLITKAQARRSLKAAAARERPEFKVRCCSPCNVSKGTRLRVPPLLAGLIPELEAITGGVYAVFDGTPESLREVVR